MAAYSKPIFLITSTMKSDAGRPCVAARAGGGPLAWAGIAYERSCASVGSSTAGAG